MKRAKYTEEYKRDALDLVKRNGSLKSMAFDLMIEQKIIHHIRFLYSITQNWGQFIDFCVMVQYNNFNDNYSNYHQQLRLILMRL